MAANFGIPSRIFAMHERFRSASDRLRSPRDASSPFWASELGKCGRAITFSMLGYPAESVSGKSARIFRMGDIVEANVIDELRDAGFIVSACEADCNEKCGEHSQRRIRIKNPLIVGKIDGLITSNMEGTPVTRLLELKSMNTRGFGVLRQKGIQESQPGYYAQIQAYLFGLGLSEATVLVEDKNTQDLYEETIPYDDAYVADLFIRMQAIRRYADAGKLAPPEYPKSSFQCRYCAFSDRCSGLPEPEKSSTPSRARLAKRPPAGA